MDIIKSISYDQSEILAWVSILYLDGDGFDMDPTYGYGGFYKSIIPKPRFVFDNRTLDGVSAVSDCTRLPLRDKAVHSIVFDPPFIIRGNRTESTRGKMANRFGCFHDRGEREVFYLMSLMEFYRVLDKGGILIFKCQDEVDSHINVFTHVYVHEAALSVGYTPEDLFILTRKSTIGRYNIKHQEHARKFHSYFWVFKKK